MVVPTTLLLIGATAMTIYLYVKTHLITGLKYLGQTSAKDPHKYPGSGTYWRLHLEKHGYSYNTQILKECQAKDEVKDWGTYYSNLWNIVESNEWANLKIESGDGGVMSPEIIKKAQITRKKNGKKQSPESRAKAVRKRKENGWIISDTTKQKLSIINKGKKRSHESIDKQLRSRIENGTLQHTETTKAKMRKPKPSGFSKKLSQAHKEGRHSGSKDRIWITNGQLNLRIKKSDPIPDGWYQGCTTTAVPPSQKGKFWITNGIETKMSFDIPEGWWRGRIKQNPVI